jgi:serine/threonine-protein kinase HipA
MRQANIFCRGVLAGVLSRDETADCYRFQYAPEYLSNPAYPAISLSFPKQDVAYESPVLFPFFFGLLAEGENKALQCRILKIDESDHFTRLLRTCAAETIGGITVQEVS